MAMKPRAMKKKTPATKAKTKMMRGGMTKKADAAKPKMMRGGMTKKAGMMRGGMAKKK